MQIQSAAAESREIAVICCAAFWAWPTSRSQRSQLANSGAGKLSLTDSIILWTHCCFVAAFIRLSHDCNRAGLRLADGCTVESLAKLGNRSTC